MSGERKCEQCMNALDTHKHGTVCMRIFSRLFRELPSGRKVKKERTESASGAVRCGPTGQFWEAKS